MTIDDQDLSNVTDIRVLLSKSKLRRIMSEGVISINQDEPFIEVPRKMAEYHIRHLPVVDNEKKLVGLMTQRELYKIHSPRKLMDGTWHYDRDMLNNIILKHVMIKDPICMKADDPISEALIRMIHGAHKCISIVDDDSTLIGIITEIDILKAAARFYSKT